MIKPFVLAKLPKIIFGAGKFADAPKLIKAYGRNVLLVTGAGSHQTSGRWETLLEALRDASIRSFHYTVKGEPSPDIVDAAVAEFKDKNIEVVMSWGGGSVIDAGKAISAMLPQNKSVRAFLEGVGHPAAHDGRKVPFIAAPTTGGTGTEASKNAVLSQVGPDGFKKSLRHDNFVPDVALVDPELALSCPPHITAACGLDAFTQLLESYVSTGASPLTDALALSGLQQIKSCLIPVCTDQGHDIGMRAGMAYAALLSGITLAHAGLGIVHGLAAPLGGYFEIPHGVVCGTLLGTATRSTIEKLRAEHGLDHHALVKYAEIGALFSGENDLSVDQRCRRLTEIIERWIETLHIPRLSAYGIRESDLAKVVAIADNKNNPVWLDASEVRNLLARRL